MPEATDPRAEALRAHLVPPQPGDAMSEAARRALLKDLIQMLEHEAGSRAGADSVGVHKMRVATRRMRSTLLLLGDYFKASDIRPFLRELRRLAQALGTVRDLDVMIDNLARYQATLDEAAQADLVPMLALLHERRAAARRKLVAAFDKKAYQRFTRDFSAFVTTPNAGARRPSKDQPFPPEARYLLPIEVYRHLAAIRAYDRVIGEAGTETLHALRIEFKRLRYLIAIFEPMLGERGATFINELRAIQDHLGALNDAAAAQRQLRGLLPEVADGQPPVLENYLSELSTSEARLRATFPDVWKRFNSRAVQRRLAGAIAGL